jgi:hypothetical protein
MQHLVPGDTAELMLARQGKVINLTVALQEAIADKYQITILPDIDRRQKERMSAWLGVQLKFVSN